MNTTGPPQRKTGKQKSDYTIQTVQNALRLLEAFDHEDEIGVSELSRRLSLHKNNVFRLLATLEQGGYIEQSSRSERYRLGVRCLELGNAYARSHDLVRSARPVLASLAEQLGETAHLGVLDGFEVVHLDGEQPRQLLMSAERVGARLPAYCTAIGKVLLAQLSGEERRRLDQRLSANELPARTPSTIVDAAKLQEHLRGVAVQGWAVDLEEFELGLRCCAAPVLDANGRVRGALSVSGPAVRLSEERLLGEGVAAVSAAAAELSRRLGA